MNVFYNEEEKKRLSGEDGVRVDEIGRTGFRKDFERLLHAPAFRRLQGKTQLFPGVESDFFRNRLTHSLEVANIACGIAARLNATGVKEHFPSGSEIDLELVEFAAIAHDLGHPPFGHNGEKALDEMMRKYGGFEGNAQTLRILTAIERKIYRGADGGRAHELGLNLTHRALASVLKYDRCIPSVRERPGKVEKGYYGTEAGIVAKVKERVAPKLGKDQSFKTIECAIMDIADDIAYSTYDLEDSLHARFVTPLTFAKALDQDHASRASVKEKTNKTLEEAGYPPADDKELMTTVSGVFGLKLPGTVAIALDDAVKSAKHEQKVSHPSPTSVLLIHLEAAENDQRFATDSLWRAEFTAKRIGRLIAAVELRPNLDSPALSTVRMRRTELLEVEVMKHLNYELVIRSTQLAVVEHRGKDVVQRIFKAIVASEGMLLPHAWREKYREEAGKGISHARRVVCDYVAGMTDRHAAETYDRLFGDGATIFKPL